MNITKTITPKRSHWFAGGAAGAIETVRRVNQTPSSESQPQRVADIFRSVS